MTEREQSGKNDERPAINAQVNVLKEICKLRRSEDVYRSLVESTEDSIYLVDRDCRYLFMSDKHLSRLGLSADRVIGTTYGELHSPEETKELAEKVNQVFETGKSIRHEHRSRRDGRYILRTLSPVKEPAGKVTAVTVVSKDISALKQVEKELIATKDYLDNIINSSADTVTVVDMNGIVRDWNKGADGFMGYLADEVIGRQNSILFADPEDADRIQELLRREGEIKNYRTIALRKDGKPVHISMSAALLKYKDGVPIGSVRVSRDVTKDVVLEERLKKERDNLKLILESMVDTIYIVSKDYKIEFMNRVLIDEVGDQVGAICYKAFHNRVEPCQQCKKVEVLTGKTVRWEWYAHRMNKTYDLIETPLRNVDGSISKLTIFRDITKRKQMEQELDESNKFLETVIETIPDTITLKDSEHRLVLVNQAYCKISDVTKDEAIGKTVLRERDNEVFQTGKGLDLTERTYTDREGNRHYVSVKKAPLTDESGNVSHVLTISRDITETMRAAEERERLLKEIETKNSELERFSYTVSHDLRSPLITIQGFANLLREDSEQGKTEDLASQLEYIETAATKMDRLITDTLQLSRIGRVVNPPKEVPFGALVQEAQEQIKSGGVEVTVADDFPSVCVDRMRIVEVLVNLITNSIKYMGEQRQPKIDMGYRVDGKTPVFFVQDNGMGIDKSQHETVFELFHKVDSSSNGTGAGLAIVKRIIEVHKGRIWIESEEGKGCTVCFTLPLSPVS